MLAGQIDLLIDGQPCVLRGQGQNLLIEVRSLRALFKLQASWTSTLLPLHATMGMSNLRVFVHSGWWVSWEVFPHPPLWMRWFLPRQT